MVSTAAADAKQFDTTDRVLNSQTRFHRTLGPEHLQGGHVTVVEMASNTAARMASRRVLPTGRQESSDRRSVSSAAAGAAPPVVLEL